MPTLRNRVVIFSYTKKIRKNIEENQSKFYFFYFWNLALAWPSIFSYTKKIQKNTEENQSQFYLAYNFLFNTDINLISWQVNYILPNLSIDTHIGHIHNHKWSGHNGHYGPFSVIMANMGVHWKIG